MNIYAENFLKNYGFVEDVNSSHLKAILKNDLKIKEVHIDIYPEMTGDTKDYMLLLRTIEKNSIIENDGNRMILTKNDRLKTQFMNVIISKIVECFYKFSDNCFEFIFKIQNIYYRLTVLN